MEMEQRNYPKIWADGWNRKAQAGVCLQGLEQAEMERQLVLLGLLNPEHSSV